MRDLNSYPLIFISVVSGEPSAGIRWISCLDGIVAVQRAYSAFVRPLASEPVRGVIENLLLPALLPIQELALHTLEYGRAQSRSPNGSGVVPV